MLRSRVMYAVKRGFEYYTIRFADLDWTEDFRLAKLFDSSKNDSEYAKDIARRNNATVVELTIIERKVL